MKNSRQNQEKSPTPCGSNSEALRLLSEWTIEMFLSVVSHLGPRYAVVCSVQWQGDQRQPRLADLSSYKMQADVKKLPKTFVMR